MAVQPLNVRRLDVRPFWANTVRLGGQVLHNVVFTRRVNGAVVDFCMMMIRRSVDTNVCSLFIRLSDEIVIWLIPKQSIKLQHTNDYQKIYG